MKQKLHLNLSNMVKIYDSVLRDSLLGCPFAPKKKPIFGMIGNIVSSLVGAGSQALTNKSNKEIAAQNVEAQKQMNEQNIQMQRETNAQNYQMFQEQNAFNEEMWNKQNAYNDPKAQVERLLNAGLNPAGSQATEAGGLSSASPAPAVAPQGVAPHNDYRAEPLDFSGIGQGINAYFQNQLLNSQVKEKDVDTAIKRVQLAFEAQRNMSELMDKIADIGNKLANTKLTDKQRENLEEQRQMLVTQHNLMKDTYEDLKKRESLQNDLLNEQRNNLVSDTQLKRIQSRYQDLLVQYYPQLTKMQIEQANAQIANIVQNTVNLVEEGKLTGKKAIAQNLENQMTEIDLWERKFKHGVNYGSHGTKVVKAFSDYVSGLIFGNLKLRGK